MTVRLRFLPTFFIVLAIVFAVAVGFRLRAYRNVDAVVADTTPGATTSLTTSAEPPRVPGDENESFTVVPATGTKTSRAMPMLDPADVSVATPPRSAAGARALPTAPPPPSARPSPAAPRRPLPGGEGVQAPPPPSRTPATSISSNTTTTTTTTTATEKPVEKDPNSDTTPPRLVTLDFNPTAIRDGEFTILHATAIDDLSGVRSISGTVVSPAGALTGFSLQREPETDRYQGRIEVPAEAADGIWKISFMSLVDMASNAVYLNQSTLPPTAQFKVTSSSPDTKGPQLKAIWVDRVALRGGEQTTVNVQVDDEQTGVKLVTGVFLSPSRFARLGFGCQQRGDTWQCPLNTPVCLDCGDWQLEQVQLQDKANNTTTIRTDNPLIAAIRLNILAEQCDNVPPILQSVVFDKSVVSNAQDSKILVTVTGTDNLCGVESISGYVVPDGGPTQTREPFSLRASGDPTTWTGEITIRRLAAKGIWKINWLQIVDKGKNLRGYGSTDPALAGATFRVQ